MPKIEKYYLKDGSVRYMFQAYLGVDPLTGKKKRTTRRNFKTIKDAKIAYSKLMVEVDEYGLKRDENLTFQDVYKEWFDQHKKEVKLTTQTAIRCKFKRVLHKFGRLKIKDITGRYCQRVVNEWAEELKTFNDYKIQANLVFKYAVKKDIIKVNPMEYVTLPKRKDEINFDLEEENLSKFYTKQELKRFLDAIKNNSMVYAMFRLLSYTGARKGEICALHWSDINFKKKSIRLNKTLINADGKKMLQTSKTKASRRVISVDDETLSILKKWRKEQIEAYLKNSFSFERDDKQPVFTNLNHLTKKMDYCRLAYLNEQLNRIYKNNKHLPRITIHGFRHTHASLLFAAGASIKDVQDRLGHSDIKTTMNIYTHVTNEAKEKTADLFQEYMKL